MCEDGWLNLSVIPKILRQRLLRSAMENRISTTPTDSVKPKGTASSTVERSTADKGSMELRMPMVLGRMYLRLSRYDQKAMTVPKRTT